MQKTFSKMSPTQAFQNLDLSEWLTEFFSGNKQNRKTENKIKENRRMKITEQNKCIDDRKEADDLNYMGDEQQKKNELNNKETNINNFAKNDKKSKKAKKHKLF